MNIERIRRIARDASVSELMKVGVPRRTAYRLVAGGEASLTTLQKLEAWAKTQRLKREPEAAQ